MKIVTICPIRKTSLYVSDVKPCLLKLGAKGDWGYSTKCADAVELTPRQAMIAMRDLEVVGRSPRFI